MPVKTKKLSKKSQPLPLWWQLKEKIKEEIINNELQPDDKLPTELKLMSEYEVSRITVVKTLSQLASEGIIYRIQGKGTFVKGNKPVLKKEEIIGLIMPTTGHIYESLSKKIIHGLTDHHYFCIIIDYNGENRNSIKKIKDLIDRHPAILIIQGISRFPFNFLDNYPGKVIFLQAFEAEKRLPRARYILSDYFAGGRIVAEYLIYLGHEKIIFYTYPIFPGQKNQMSVIEGAKSVFKEKNIPEENFIIFTKSSQIAESLKKEKKPMAVFCNVDFMAKLIYETAKKLNLRIPEDISVVGYNNTPWCEIFKPNLTSVSIREAEIAEYVIDEITGKNINKKIIFKPKLIIRDSTTKKIL
ncbi:MAG: substrate-binding domain-containing protein [Candidatus Omnitrophica bacterium]|jgi:GntR family transcriptional regulator of arabinose operon|nr:substrate-binding domain-containing protein [Candidatus Omnitrophota bacterium]